MKSWQISNIILHRLCDLEKYIEIDVKGKGGMPKTGGRNAKWSIEK